MNGIVLNVNTLEIPNVCTAPWNLQHIKDLKMTEWPVETCSPIISSNKCAEVNNWLIICLSTSWRLYTKKHIWGSKGFGKLFWQGSDYQLVEKGFFCMALSCRLCNTVGETKAIVRCNILSNCGALLRITIPDTATSVGRLCFLFILRHSP